MLPLTAFPTALIQKNLKPHQGFLLLLPVQITNPKTDKWLWAPYVESKIELAPIYQTIAKTFNYDAQLLAEGNGDCGVTQDIWTTYGSPSKLPLMVRWQAFGGEAIMMITDNGFVQGNQSQLQHIGLAAIADQAMTPHIIKLFDTLKQTNQTTITAAFAFPKLDALFQKLNSPDILSNTFSSEVAFNFLKQTKKEVKFIEKMIAEFTYSTFWNLDGIKHVLPENTISWNCQPWQKTSSRINPHKKYDVRLAIEPNEKVLKSTYQTLRKKSIQDVEMFMEAALAPQFGATERIATYIEGVSEIKERKITDVEVAERELKLKEVVAEIEAHKKSQNYINTVEVQFDPGFANTQGENLLGTQTSPAIHGGDLLAPQDLLEIAVNLTIGEIYQQCRCAIEGKLVKGQHLPAKYPSSPTSIHARVTEISKPYSAVFHGLPVRVNQRCTVWRNDQSIGVAIDFYFDAIYRRALIVNINQTTLQE